MTATSSPRTTRRKSPARTDQRPGKSVSPWSRLRVQGVKRFSVQFVAPSGIPRGATTIGSRPTLEQYDGCGVAWRGYIANPRDIGDAPSDGELFARAYRRWGADFQASVSGEYCAVVWDDRRRTAVVTHDGLGVMPLFYSVRGDAFHCASHLEDLVLRTGVGDLDEEFIADYIALGRHLGERTPYQHIRQLLPGQTLLWESGRVTCRSTWDLSRTPRLRCKDDAEYEERFRALAGEGVKAALRTGGPVWSELSGGLDSSTIVCTAALAGVRLPVLSLIYSRTSSVDERRWMGEVLRTHNNPWNTIDFDECPPFSGMPDGFQAIPSNVMAVSELYRRYDALLSANGAQVLLSGVGGDQVMSGDSPDPDYLADLISPFSLHRLVRSTRAWQTARGDGRSLLHALLRHAVLPRMDHARGRALRRADIPAVAPWFSAKYHKRMNLDGRDRRRHGPRGGSTSEQGFLEQIWPTMLMGTGCHQTVTSFEYRYPLLYRPLVEFMFAIPADQRVRPGEDRSLQRRALAGILPERVRTRRGKMGPQQLYHDGLQNSPEWINALTDRPRVVERGYVDAQLWQQAVEQMTVGRTHGLLHFLGTATLEVWLRQIESLPRGTAHPMEHDAGTLATAGAMR